MKIKLDFDKNKFRKQLEEAAEKAAEQEMRKRLSGLRCPEHGQTPSFRKKARTANGPQFDISACCEPMMAEAKKALAGK